METKPIWASKTFWGAVIAGLSPFITKWLGLDGFDWSGIEDAIVGVMGGVIVIYGRVKAAKQIA